MTKNKKIIQQVLGTLVAANAIIFLLLAYSQVFSDTPRVIVFIDFWGRLCVYSLGLRAMHFYRKYLPGKAAWLLKQTFSRLLGTNNCLFIVVYEFYLKYIGEDKTEITTFKP
jgi:hypothetical protein